MLPPIRCPACVLFGNVDRGSRLWIQDAPVEGEPTYNLRDFLAIDRFTGGAYSGAKFDALPLVRPSFTVKMTLWNPRRWELLLLAHTLWDLDTGLMNIGWKAASGFGRCSVKSVTLRFGAARAADLPVVFGTEENGQAGAHGAKNEKGIGGPYSGILESRTWSGSAAEMAALVQADWPGDPPGDAALGGAYARLLNPEQRPGGDGPTDAPTKDNYFGTSLEKLYPVYTSQDRFLAEFRDPGADEKGGAE